MEENRLGATGAHRIHVVRPEAMIGIFGGMGHPITRIGVMIIAATTIALATIRMTESVTITTVVERHNIDIFKMITIGILIDVREGMNTLEAMVDRRSIRDLGDWIKPRWKLINLVETLGERKDRRLTGKTPFPMLIV